MLQPRSSAAGQPEQQAAAAAAAAGPGGGEAPKLPQAAQDKIKSVLQEYLRTKDLDESVEIFKVAAFPAPTSRRSHRNPMLSCTPLRLDRRASCGATACDLRLSSHPFFQISRHAFRRASSRAPLCLN